MGLVVKSWAADSKPVDEVGNHVVIACRQEGILAFLLSMLGIDPVTTLMVHPERIEFVQASLNGTKRRIIPFTSVSSTYYGFHKPLKEAIGLIIVGTFLSSAALGAIGKPGLLAIVLPLLIIVALVYYFLNMKLRLGIVEMAGLGFGAEIEFKRSLIEGKKVEEPEARRVCEIVQMLVEAHLPQPRA